MTIEEAIKKAIEGGWNMPYDYQQCSLSNGWTDHSFLDPAFWQALEKAMGWNVEIRYGKCGNPDCDGSGCDKPGTGNWLYRWHRFIDHLAEGKTAEDYFKDL